MHHSLPTEIIETADIMEYRKQFAAKEDAVLNVEEIGEVAVSARVPVI